VKEAARLDLEAEVRESEQNANTELEAKRAEKVRNLKIRVAEQQARKEQQANTEAVKKQASVKARKDKREGLKAAVAAAKAMQQQRDQLEDQRMREQQVQQEQLKQQEGQQERQQLEEERQVGLQQLRERQERRRQHECQSQAAKVKAKEEAKAEQKALNAALYRAAKLEKEASEEKAMQEAEVLKAQAAAEQVKQLRQEATTRGEKVRQLQLEADAALKFALEQQEAPDRLEATVVTKPLPTETAMPEQPLICEVCVVCSQKANFRCSKCEKAHYCSAEHQRNHWQAGHRHECGDQSGELSSAALEWQSQHMFIHLFTKPMCQFNPEAAPFMMLAGEAKYDAAACALVLAQAISPLSEQLLHNNTALGTWLQRTRAYSKISPAAGHATVSVEVLRKLVHDQRESYADRRGQKHTLTLFDVDEGDAMCAFLNLFRYAQQTGPAETTLEPEICPICLDPLTPDHWDTSIVPLPCGHNLHRQCLKNVREGAVSEGFILACPLCRASVPPRAVKMSLRIPDSWTPGAPFAFRWNWQQGFIANYNITPSRDLLPNAIIEVTMDTGENILKPWPSARDSLGIVLRKHMNEHPPQDAGFQPWLSGGETTQRTSSCPVCNVDGFSPELERNHIPGLTCEIHPTTSESRLENLIIASMSSKDACSVCKGACWVYSERHSCWEQTPHGKKVQDGQDGYLEQVPCQANFVHLPPVLSIGVNRIVCTSSGRFTGSYYSGPVSFPTLGLDMAPFFPVQCPPGPDMETKYDLRFICILSYLSERSDIREHGWVQEEGCYGTVGKRYMCYAKSHKDNRWYFMDVCNDGPRACPDFDGAERIVSRACTTLVYVRRDVDSRE
jgi:hypothetical protein